jgi:hypothetical protein
MWATVIIGIICLGIGCGGGIVYQRSTMESAQERGNLAKKLSALPYLILDFMSNSKFSALTPDDRLDFITAFFRSELKDLSVAAYTTTQIALDEFYRRKKLNPAAQMAAAKE